MEGSNLRKEEGGPAATFQRSNLRHGMWNSAMRYYLDREFY